MLNSQSILETVARRAKVTAGFLCLSREKDVTAWRMIAIHMMRESGMTMASIAAAVGRDASTIHYVSTKINKLKNQKWFIEMLASIEEEQRLDVFCRQRIPMTVYAAAFAASDD